MKQKNKERAQETRIFLDLDGVMVNQPKSTIELFGHPPPENKEFGNDRWIADYLSDIFDRDTDTWDKKFYTKHKECLGFWENLDKYFYSDDLLNLCIDLVGEEKVFFATKPMAYPDSYSGKYAWVVKNYPNMSKRLFLAHDKSQLASSPSDLLIDNSLSNKKKWEKRGGSFFHWKDITDNEDFFEATVWQRFADIEEIVKKIHD